MTLTETIDTLKHYAQLAVFPEYDRAALSAATEVLSKLQEALAFPPGTSIADAASLMGHKCSLPEAPTSLLRLPSADSSLYDLYAIVPGGYGLSATVDAVNHVIATVNNDALRSDSGAHQDSESVEFRLRERLADLGLPIIGIETTHCWDAPPTHDDNG